MYCVFCGKPASQQTGARFCLYCGKPLEVNATPPKSTNATQEIKVNLAAEPLYQWPEPTTSSTSTESATASTGLAPVPAAEFYGPWSATNPYYYNPGNPYGQPPQGYYNPSYSQYQQYQQQYYYWQNYQPFGNYYQPYQGQQANTPPNSQIYNYNPFYSVEQQRFVPPRPSRQYPLSKNIRDARKLAIGASVISLFIYPLLGAFSRSAYYYGSSMGRNIFAIVLGFIAASILERNPKAGGIMLIIAGIISLVAVPFGLLGTILFFTAAIMALPARKQP